MATETVVKPAAWNLTVYQGDSFPFKFTVAVDGVPVDLSQAVIRAHVRIAETTVEPMVEFTVVSHDANGFVELLLEPAKTAIMQSGMWDVEIENAGVTRTYLKGTVTVIKDVTK